MPLRLLAVVLCLLGSAAGRPGPEPPLYLANTVTRFEFARTDAMPADAHRTAAPLVVRVHFASSSSTTTSASPLSDLDLHLWAEHALLDGAQILTVSSPPVGSPQEASPVRRALSEDMLPRSQFRQGYAVPAGSPLPAAAQRGPDLPGLREAPELRHVQGRLLPGGGLDLVVLDPHSGLRLHIEPAARYADAAAHPQRPAAYDHVAFWSLHVQHNSTHGTPTCGTAAHSRLAQRQRELLPNLEPVPTTAAAPLQLQLQRRAASQCESKCYCPVTVVCDYECFEHFRLDAAEAAAAIINLLSVANRIFYFTTFGDLTGIGLSVYHVLVYTDKGSSNPVPLPGSSYTADKYLELFSGENFGQACLAHVFTHRDFEDGILGLAFVGTLCQSKYNTGFSTSLNFGSQVAPVVQQLTLAHEIAHNFGSPHDSASSAVCSPGGTEGNFIMTPYATDGNLPNNNKFSPCSIDAMTSGITSRRGSCFVNSAATCGNGIVEGTEVCDCGDKCASDPCCTTNCTLPASAQCSPQDPVRFPCCDATCKYTAAAANKQCGSGTECMLPPVCNGNSASCPAALPRESNSSIPCGCDQGDCKTFPSTAVAFCDAGACNRSYCTLFGAEQCFLAGEAGCQLGCSGPGWGDGKSCISTSDPDRTKMPSGVNAIFLPAGSTCDSFKGYCSENGRCITVKSEEFLDRLDDFISGLSVSGSVNWIKANWPYLLMGLGGVIILCLLLRATNPHKKRGRYRTDAADDDEIVPLVERNRSAAIAASPNPGRKLRKEGYHHAGMSKDTAHRLLRSAGTDGTFLVWDLPGRKGGDYKYCLSVVHQGVIKDIKILQDHRSERLYVEFDVSRKFRDLDSLVARFRYSGSDVIPCALTGPIVFGSLDGRRALRA